jgi:hypothetical protein
VIDGGEQSEIWGEFRFARRAKNLGAKIAKDNNTVEFIGAFRGFYNVANQIKHKRAVTVALSTDGRMLAKLSVADQLYGRGNHTADSYIHFHPDFTLAPARSGDVKVVDGDSLVAVIRSTAEQEFRIEPGVFCPEFGKQIPNQVLVFRSQGPMPLTLGYEIEIILR